ncbi:uncharacterized protein LOC129592665 isoform X2 [Paramacrobiotus metropolitanus]|uniref:uncharacterized protein LOC129592665 isoform X2 n=1 Tax=Paramacrobiotus metropolitanus TaxID=2943436 RepID=UPI0024456AC9|nr:uncharacterized protein LOC129592665 isoform X2 [Paramacrobiotus metropolitanus]
MLSIRSILQLYRTWLRMLHLCLIKMENITSLQYLTFVTQSAAEGYEWNLVDIQGNDGLLHCGRITDSGDEGFLVDFGCGKEHAPQFVPFGRIYRYRNRSLFDDITTISWDITRSIDEKEEFPVEVLLRFHPAEACKWYPGTMLLGDFALRSFGFVRIPIAGTVMKCIVPAHRIRTPSTEGHLTPALVVKGDRYHAMIGHSARTDKGALTARCKKTRNNGLVEQLIRTSQEWKLPLTDGSSGVRFANGLATLKWMDFVLLSDDTTYSLPQDSQKDSIHNDCTIHCLSTEVLLEMFCFVTSIEKCKLRRVCITWKNILTSPAAAYLVLLRNGPYPSAYAYIQEGDYLHAACLFNCWNKVVVIDGCKSMKVWKDQMPSCHGGFLQRIISEGGYHPAETLILTNVFRMMYAKKRGENSAADFIVELTEEINSYMRVCQQLVLRNITMVLFGGFLGDIIVKIRAGRISRDQRKTVPDWWTVLDNCCPSLNECDLSSLATWIRDAHYRAANKENLEPSLHSKVLSVLHNLQSADPRASVHYRGERWSMESLINLDVRKLKTFTCYTLRSIQRNHAMAPVPLGVNLSW